MHVSHFSWLDLAFVPNALASALNSCNHKDVAFVFLLVSDVVEFADVSSFFLYLVGNCFLL